MGKRYAVEEVLYRADGRCGSSFPLPNGSPSQCNPEGDFPCCSKYGYCGRDSGHCQCEKCIDYRQDSKKENELYRADGRCGSSFPLPNGSSSQCNPESDFPCCSEYGYCGAESGHCQCEKCID